MTGALAMLVAMALDALIGWPDVLYQRIGHPVTWLGAVIRCLERRLNRPSLPRIATGAVTVVITIAIAAIPAWLLTHWLPGGGISAIVIGVLAWPLVAVRSMYTHVADVAVPLETGDLPAARHAVSMIVGRDPSHLDEPGVGRAALESLAENTSDGIVAPVFWGAVLGLPGIAAYKAINTMDSMIGHRNDRYLLFGRVAARLDDLANLIPARLSGLLFALTSVRPRAALRCMVQDARQHRSPNAGWPESALAGALNVRLSGPRRYDTGTTDDPFVNANASDPTAYDLRRGLSAYIRTMLGLAVLLGLCVLI